MFNYNLPSIWRFIKLNFFSEHVRAQGGFLILYPKADIVFKPNSVIELHGNMTVGIPTIKHSKVRSIIVMNENSRICVNIKCDIMEGCDIQMQNHGILSVDNFHSNIDLEVSCGNQIRMVGDITAGRHVRIKDFNGHEVSYSGYPLSKSVIIENHVWLCTGATINPGVVIGHGSVIADNSDVSVSVPPCSFVKGNPGVVVESNITFNI